MAAGLASAGIGKLLWFIIVETLIRARSEYTGYWKNEMLDRSGDVVKTDFFRMRHDAKTGEVRGIIVRAEPDAISGCKWNCTGAIVNGHFLFFFCSTGGLSSDGSGYGILQKNLLHTFEGSYLSTSKAGKLVRVDARTVKLSKGSAEYDEARRMLSPLWVVDRLVDRLACIMRSKYRARMARFGQNARAKRHTVSIEFDAPGGAPDAEYRLRLVKYGKAEFNPPCDNVPLNRDYKPAVSDCNRVAFRLRRVYVNRGFQFKCYAKCRNRDDALVMRDALLSAFDYAGTPYDNDLDSSMKERFPPVDIPAVEDNEVWFVLPNYPVYITTADDELHPYLNNYRDIGGL